MHAGGGHGKCALGTYARGADQRTVPPLCRRRGGAVRAARGPFFSVQIVSRNWLPKRCAFGPMAPLNQRSHDRASRGRNFGALVVGSRSATQMLRIWADSSPQLA